MRLMMLRRIARKGGIPGLLLAGIYVVSRLAWTQRSVRIAAAALLAALGAFIITDERRPEENQNADPALSAPAYDIVDLGTSGLGVAITALNNRGEAAGVLIRDDQSAHAAIWQGGKLRDLGTLGGEISLATALNDSGVVVGISQLDSTRFVGFRWAGRKMEELKGLNAFLSGATSINRRGQAAGFYYTMENGANRPCVWSNGQGKALPLPDGWQDAAAQDINDRGLIIGSAYCSVMEISQAVIWQRGQARELNTLGGVNSMAATVSEDGVIGGTANPKGSPVDEWHAVTWTNGRIRDVGILPGQQWAVVTGINRTGELVGASGVG